MKRGMFAFCVIATFGACAPASGADFVNCAFVKYDDRGELPDGAGLEIIAFILGKSTGSQAAYTITDHDDRRAILDDMFPRSTSFRNDLLPDRSMMHLEFGSEDRRRHVLIDVNQPADQKSEFYSEDEFFAIVSGDNPEPAAAEFLYSGSCIIDRDLSRDAAQSKMTAFREAPAIITGDAQ